MEGLWFGCMKYNSTLIVFSDNSGCSFDSECPSERPTCEDKKCVNKSK